MSKNTYSPKSSGIWRGTIYQDECIRKVDLTELLEQQPEDGRLLVGFHPETNEAMHLTESFRRLQLPEPPGDTTGVGE